MQENETEKFVQMNLRLSDGLRSQLKELAARNRRSMNAEIQFHLERMVANAGAERGAA